MRSTHHASRLLRVASTRLYKPLATSFTLCNVRYMATVNKTDAEWKQLLTPEEFKVCRQKGTEPPNVGEYTGNKKPGVYTCKCCGTQLFKSTTKYESYSGWPSFWDAEPNAVKEHSDYSLGMSRTEVTCAKCDCHLGHVFNDGPKPTNQRYCINSISLKFEEDKKDEKK